MKEPRPAVVRCLSVTLLLFVACSTPAEEPAAKPPGRSEQKPALARVSPGEFGEPFPSHAFGNLNAGAGGAETVDLADDLGKRSVVFYYWIPGHDRADQMFVELQEMVDQIGSSKLALFGAVKLNPNLDASAVRERAKNLKIHVPVLDDEGFRLGQQLTVRSVPNISIVDAQGRLRLTNAASFRQTLEYNMDLEAALRRVAATGSLGTYGALPRYYPVKELVGQKCPDFEAPGIFDGEVRRWSHMIASDRLNVLVFWSVDCPHCKKTLPKLNDWLKKHPDGINLVSAAAVGSEAEKVKTKEYCQLNGFVFTTLLDQDLTVGRKFNVTSTPTVLIIGPDGVVDSVVLTMDEQIGQALEQKKRELLAPAKS